jgi:hypothetical protein
MKKKIIKWHTTNPESLDFNYDYKQLSLSKWCFESQLGLTRLSNFVSFREITLFFSIISSVGFASYNRGEFCWVSFPTSLLKTRWSPCFSAFSVTVSWTVILHTREVQISFPSDSVHNFYWHFFLISRWLIDYVNGYIPLGACSASHRSRQVPSDVRNSAGAPPPLYVTMETDNSPKPFFNSFTLFIPIFHNIFRTIRPSAGALKLFWWIYCTSYMSLTLFPTKFTIQFRILSIISFSCAVRVGVSFGAVCISFCCLFCSYLVTVTWFDVTID